MKKMNAKKILEQDIEMLFFLHWATHNRKHLNAIDKLYAFGYVFQLDNRMWGEENYKQIKK